MSILYLKNRPVFDVNEQMVLDRGRCPGLLQRNPSGFKQWMKYRYSSNTNSFARALKGVTFGQGNRVKIDAATHAFSLSDSYWVSDDPSLGFEELSPYCADFWRGEGEYQGGAVPTLYANGFLNKCWISSREMFKAGDLQLEVECLEIAWACGVQCAKGRVASSGIFVENFTTAEVMLESAEMSGRIDPDDFDESTIVREFGFSGLQMIVLDAIFGNGDRHAGNFGFLRSIESGEYLGMAPLYDFDHALDAKGVGDPLLKSAVEVAGGSSWARAEALRICKQVQKVTKQSVFLTRAQHMENLLEEVPR